MTDEREDEAPDTGADGGVAESAAEFEVPGFEQRIARRNALKKAAAGAAVAGAVWNAPRVEGLSLVPDYASAGTGTASVTFKIGTADFGNNPAYYGDDPGNAGDGCNNLADDNYAVFNPANGPAPANLNNPGITVPAYGPTQSANINMVANLGGPAPSPIGTVTVAVASGADADLPNTDNTRWNVAFSVDPPFNKCRVTSVNMKLCGNNTPVAIPVTSPANPPLGTPNAAPGSFTVPIVIPTNPGTAETVTIQVDCT